MSIFHYCYAKADFVRGDWVAPDRFLGYGGTILDVFVRCSSILVEDV